MKQWQKILLGAVVVYVVYRMFFVREGLSGGEISAILIGIALTFALISYYYPGREISL